MDGEAGEEGGAVARIRMTERLRLQAIGSDTAEDLFRLHQDPGVAQWYGGAWTPEQAGAAAESMARGWRVDGVHKWVAHDRRTGELVGRGGLSYAEVAGERRLEIGWAVRRRLWGKSYATEIGRAGLAVAFGDLGAAEVVSFTETDNRRSRAVMERLGFDHDRDIRHRGEPFALYVLRRP